MRLDILAIAAHPDDVELTCGGTLIKSAQQGYRTGILDLTRGEMGTRGTPETRAKEAARAARILGVKLRDNLGLPDSAVEATYENKLLLARKIREWRPHVVIIPYWEGRHPDHYNAAKLAYEGCFLAGLKRLPIAGEPHRPFKVIYAAAYNTLTQPSFVVDITKQFERRKRAILCYASQFAPPKAQSKQERRSKVFIPLDQLHGEMHRIARHYGQMAGVQYAEPFIVKEIAVVDDLMNLPVRSI